MALTLLKTRVSPSLGYSDLTMQFDAVLEDVFEASVTLTDYPLEVGASSNDHRIINPVRWTITGAVSNNPLRILATDFTGALSEISSDSGILAATGGIMAGWLSGSDEARTTEALEGLITLMNTGEPFSVYAGDITLSNMVIEKIRRTKDASNENTLIFTAELREWLSIETATSSGTDRTDAITGTSTASAAANQQDNGEVSTSTPLDSVVDQVFRVVFMSQLTIPLSGGESNANQTLSVQLGDILLIWNCIISKPGSG